LEELQSRALSAHRWATRPSRGDAEAAGSETSSPLTNVRLRKQADQAMRADAQRLRQRSHGERGTSRPNKRIRRLSALSRDQIGGAGRRFPNSNRQILASASIAPPRDRVGWILAPRKIPRRHRQTAVAGIL